MVYISCYDVLYLGDDETCLKLQSVVMDGIEDLSRVVNSILTTYPEINFRGIRSSLAALTENSKCKLYDCPALIYAIMCGICV